MVLLSMIVNILSLFVLYICLYPVNLSFSLCFAPHFPFLKIIFPSISLLIFTGKSSFQDCDFLEIWREGGKRGKKSFELNGS